MFFYIHIPFCRQRCHYCKFALTPYFNEIKIRTYLDVLKREIEEFFQIHPDVSIESIYFGGGTPSILSLEQLSVILGIFQHQRGYDPSIEMTLESNPEDITCEYLHVLSGLGINRLSLGVQTFNSDSLRMIGRSDSNVSIFQALQCIADGPIINISLDLIAGLPCTMLGQIEKDLDEIYSYIMPKHMSIYMLEDENYPTNWKPYLPSHETICSEYLSAVTYLQSKRLDRYELSNFATQGFESKHNKGYWNHSSYRGFGLSAASFSTGKRFTNSASFSGYYRGEKECEEVLSFESLRIERIMFGMRTHGVFLSDINNIGGMNMLVGKKLIEIRENKVFLTSTGIFLIDYIIGELI